MFLLKLVEENAVQLNNLHKCSFNWICNFRNRKLWSHRSSFSLTIRKEQMMLIKVKLHNHCPEIFPETLSYNVVFKWCYFQLYSLFRSNLTNQSLWPIWYYQTTSNALYSNRVLTYYNYNEPHDCNSSVLIQTLLLKARLMCYGWLYHVCHASSIQWLWVYNYGFCFSLSSCLHTCHNHCFGKTRQQKGLLNGWI